MLCGKAEKSAHAKNSTEAEIMLETGLKIQVYLMATLMVAKFSKMTISTIHFVKYKELLNKTKMFQLSFQQMKATRIQLNITYANSTIAHLFSGFEVDYFRCFQSKP